MTAKQYLSQAYRAIEKAAELRKQIERLNDEMARLGRSITEGSKVQFTPPKDPMGDRVADVVDKIAAREKQLARWEDILYSVEDALNSLDCVTCYKVLHGKYVQDMTLPEVATELGYSIHQVKRMHTVGLAEIEAFLQSEKLGA